MDINLIHLILSQVIMFTWCSYISLLKNKTFAVVVYQCPLSDIKLSAFKKQRLFNILLNDKLEAFQLFDSLFIWRILFLLVLFSLELFCFCTNPLLQRIYIYSVIIPKDVPQILNWVENVNTNTSIVSSWFQKPKVLLLMFSISNLIRCLKSLFAFCL